MSIGLIAISTNQKKEQSGPPFAAGSANNGTSVDAVTGKIVLGNDVGDVLGPGALVSSREIDTDFSGTAYEILLKAILARVITHLAGDHIEISGEDFTTPFFRVVGTEGASVSNETISGDDSAATILLQTGNGGLPLFRINNNNVDIFDISAGLGVATFTAGGSFTVITIDLANFYVQITGGTPVNFNTATLQVTGTVTKRLFAQSQGAGTYNINRDLDSAKVFRNTGALVLALPNMVGSNFRSGFYFDVHVNDISGITINAGAGVRIRFGSLATSVNGTISSTDVGAYLRIMIVDSTNYVTCFFVGAWSLT